MQYSILTTLLLLVSSLTPALAGGNCPQIARSLTRRGLLKKGGALCPVNNVPILPQNRYQAKIGMRSHLP